MTNGLMGDQKIPAHVLQVRFLSLFSKLFSIVEQRIQESPDCETYEELADYWRTLLQSKGYRRELYRKAQEVSLFRNLMKSEEDCEFSRTFASGVTQHSRIAQKSLKKLLGTIANKSGNTFTSRRSGETLKLVRLLIYFDESHELLHRETIELFPDGGDVELAKRSVYQVLCRAIENFTKFDIFAVYLSTNSSLSGYSPHNKISWSARSGEDAGDQLQAPFVELPFDIWAQVREDTLRLDDVAKAEHMVKFGRPL